MTASKYPLQLMVLSVLGSPIEDEETEKTDTSIFNSLDRAIEVGVKYSKEYNHPFSIVMLSVLADGITHKLEGPIFDYTPQHIMAIENAVANAGEVGRLQEALEEAGKLMELLADLGFIIEKAKNNKAVGGKKIKK